MPQGMFSPHPPGLGRGGFWGQSPPKEITMPSPHIDFRTSPYSVTADERAAAAAITAACAGKPVRIVTTAWLMTSKAHADSYAKARDKTKTKAPKLRHGGESVAEQWADAKTGAA